ncbi:MAG TPA: nuclease-related domain-containing protein, partial [Hyphomicrobiaceae bacterium]|nr:nuclease-related domain-containing protein [Hyphomicrobiaceae bacterium]
MIPEAPRDFHGSGGERRLFQALRTLSNDVVVLHSFRWLHPGNARALARDIGAQGEGDFIILDPARGILVVEVKGGEVWCEHGQWFQKNRRTQKVQVINPEAQAANTLYRLMPDVLDAVREARDLIFGHAVWFPDGSLEGAKLPLNYHRDMTFDGDDLA